MPTVTLERIFPATYVQAPVSALMPNRPGYVGATGTLGVLKVRYGSDEGRTRYICTFVGEAAFFTDPGLVTLDGDVLTHTYRFKPTEGVLREPLRDDLAGVYVNAWQLTGTAITSAYVRADYLDTIRARWRVLRRAELG